MDVLAERATLCGSQIDDGESTVKKGRHRRYEEARNLKRGPDLDIEALFTDLETEPGAVASVVEDDEDDDVELDPSDEFAGDLVDDRYDDER